MVGVILAAGDGTRLNSQNGCKPLVKVNSIPLIEYSLDNLIKLGLKDAYIVVGKHYDLIQNAVGNNYKGIRISYIRQPEQKGLINAFVHALNHIECDVILQLSDEIFIDLQTNEIKKHIAKPIFDFYCGITYESNPDKIKKNFSVECDEDFVIRNCIEKPEIITNNLKGTGFCMFGANVVAILKDIYNEKDNSPRELCDFINYLISIDKRGLALNVAQKEFNINTPSDLDEAQFFTDKTKRREEQ